jgi:hypothetical protein
VKGKEFKVPLFKNTQVRFQDQKAWINFLSVPEAGTNLLGRDLMSEIGIGVKILKKGGKVSLNLMIAQAKNLILPEVWTKDRNWGRIKIPQLILT